MNALRAILLAAATAGLLLGLRAAPLQGEEDDSCLCRDLVVTCTVKPKTAVIGDPFEFCATVESVGAVTLEKVQLAVNGCERARALPDQQMTVVIPSLAKGQTWTHCVSFVCQEVGECDLSAHAVDSTGIAAAGCVCTAICRGLPALQLEMIDTAIDRSPQGIFRLGEEFLYRLEVANDVGSALTPDLRISWALPLELEFVRGLGDGGATVSGQGQACSSSMFVLRPNQVRRFEIVCKVIEVPARNLVQTRAAVVLDANGQELAVETESSTLRN